MSNQRSRIRTGSFSYPDTRSESWKTTKPRDEIQAIRESVARTSSNMRHLARMVRAWKNASGVAMGGLLIDTLVYRFFEQTHDFDAVGRSSFDRMARDFFEFLKNEPKKDYYLAPGSHQRVYVKAKFQSKAKEAYNRCVEAMKVEGTPSANAIWREVFGTSVPRAKKSSNVWSFRNTEEFVEDRYLVEISETVSIDCEVTQNGWRPMKLREMLCTRTPLRVDKKLRFMVVECSVPQPYKVKWKVLNRWSGGGSDATASAVRSSTPQYPVCGTSGRTSEGSTLWSATSSKMASSWHGIASTFPSALRVPVLPLRKPSGWGVLWVVSLDVTT